MFFLVFQALLFREKYVLIFRMRETNIAKKYICVFPCVYIFCFEKESKKIFLENTPKVVFPRRGDSLLRCGARKAPHFLPWEARNASHSEGFAPSKKGLRRVCSFEEKAFNNLLEACYKKQKNIAYGNTNFDLANEGCPKVWSSFLAMASFKP